VNLLRVSKQKHEA